jgi:uncharacterized NAD(P)/FAD-binding protein YdhS
VRGLPLTVTLIDQHGRHGLGLAYSTGDDAHLLNAAAGQMSARPDDGQHLIRWANAAGRCHLPAGTPEVTATAFLPRRAYGRYLLDTLADAERQAAPSGRLFRLTGEAVAVHRNHSSGAIRVVLADGATFDAHRAVLATGNMTAELPFDAPGTGNVITDPWQPGALTRLRRAAGPWSVVIVGTGLTMLDLAITISAANPEATVHAISRHGLLPRTNPGVLPQRDQPIWLPAIFRTTAPVRITDLMRQVRAAIAASPANWHDVMGALRPMVPGLWRCLPLTDKRLFLRHLARYWEVHRHLVPPPTASRITATRCTRQLTVHRGRVLSAAPAADITRAATPLLRNLFAAGTARPDPLRLGIDATTSGAILDATGAPSDALFTLGPPLRGLWYETTAIPEIRDQATALARLITSAGTARQHHRPGSAA